MYRIESEPFMVQDHGVDFAVRLATDYAAQAARQPKPRPGNPFLEPEPELLVGEVSATHFALLNKYHVIENHLLVVTREFVDQEVLLDLADFEALVACMPGDRHAIGFYNGGHGAGASQPHKHLQVVTLPLAPWRDLPIEALVDEGVRLPFRHALARTRSRDPAELHARYRALLGEIGVRGEARQGAECQSGPYNLVIAPTWMMAVPRSREEFEAVAVNSIAFCGALFVREKHQLEAVRKAGPMAVLAQVA
jgi:ATP adenylyltransferase